MDDFSRQLSKAFSTLDTKAAEEPAEQPLDLRVLLNILFKAVDQSELGEVPETVQETRARVSVFVRPENHEPPGLTDHNTGEKYIPPADKPAYDEEGSADKILPKEKSEDDMQNPCIVRSEDDFRDDPEAPTMDVEEVPEDSIDNVVGFENFDSDISEVSPKKGDIELLKAPLLCGVEQMVEKLTNINNILEAEDDGLGRCYP
jgi:hypothetical protein